MPNEQSRRQLVLISKIVQSIGNMATPGKKEPYLQFLVGFIEEHIPKVKALYDTLIVCTDLTTYFRSQEMLLHQMSLL